MARVDTTRACERLWISTVHWLLIAFGVGGPWLIHFMFAWWAAILAIIAFLVVYKFLFVPRGSICMGIPFMLPFATSSLLLCVQTVDLVKWCLIRIRG